MMHLRAALAALIAICSCAGQQAWADDSGAPASKGEKSEASSGPANACDSAAPGCGPFGKPSDDSSSSARSVNSARPTAGSNKQANFKGLELQPTLAPEPPRPVYQGRPVQLSGGVEEKDLAIQWDDWRNQFGNSIERRIFRSPIDALLVPMGITAYFHCVVTADRHVKDVRITRSSGILWYDRAVRDAVESMDGEPVLAFPVGSQRSEVVCNIGFTHVDKKSVRYVYYGDIEHQAVDNAP